MAAATPNLQEIRLPESGTCIAQGKKLTHDESLEIEVQVTFKLHLLPRPGCVMVWLDYETNDNLSTICRQFVYILSTNCVHFVLLLSSFCPKFVTTKQQK